jgi:hypothetical protein
MARFLYVLFRRIAPLRALPIDGQDVHMSVKPIIGTVGRCGLEWDRTVARPSCFGFFDKLSGG